MTAYAPHHAAQPCTCGCDVSDHHFNTVSGERTWCNACEIGTCDAFTVPVSRTVMFFRRALRLVLRKPFALAATPARAETALLADRYDCCPCCDLDGTQCDPRDNHRAPCKDCDDPAPVLGDDMIADVRARWNDRADAAPALTPAQQAAHANLMHEINKPYLSPPRRPVNGRTLGTLPRKHTPDHPPWDTQAFPAVTDDVPDVATLIEEFGAEQMRAEYVRSQMSEGTPARDRETLRQVLDGLRNLDTPEYGRNPVADVLAAERQGLIT